MVGSPKSSLMLHHFCVEGGQESSELHEEVLSQCSVTSGPIRLEIWFEVSSTYSSTSGEGDFVISSFGSACKGSYSKFTLLLIKRFSVLISSNLYPLTQSKYPTSMHSLLRGSKSFLFSIRMWAHAWNMKMHKWITSSCIPFQAS